MPFNQLLTGQQTIFYVFVTRVSEMLDLRRYLPQCFNLYNVTMATADLFVAIVGRVD